MIEWGSLWNETFFLKGFMMLNLDTDLVVDFWDDSNSYDEVMGKLGIDDDDDEKRKKNLQSLKTFVYKLRKGGVPLKRFGRNGGGGRKKVKIDFSAIQQRLADKRGVSIEVIQEEGKNMIIDMNEIGKRIQEGIKKKN